MLSTLSSTSEAGTAVMKRVDLFTESLNEGGWVAARLAPAEVLLQGSATELLCSISAYRTDLQAGWAADRGLLILVKSKV